MLNTGLTIEDREYAGEYPMPRLGDFAMLKVKEGAEFPDIAEAGLFDEQVATSRGCSLGKAGDRKYGFHSKGTTSKESNR